MVEAPSPITSFLNILSCLLGYFESTQKTIERSNARIVENYPKFLSKFALFSLQMDDSLFRETFMVQILVFTQAIVDPVVTEQKNLFKLSKDETKIVNKVSNQVKKLLCPIQSGNSSEVTLSKRTFGESLV